MPGKEGERVTIYRGHEGTGEEELQEEKTEGKTHVFEAHEPTFPDGDDDDHLTK